MIVQKQRTVFLNFVIRPYMYVVGTHLKCLSEMLLMSTHTMFLWKIRKNYPNTLP